MSKQVTLCALGAGNMGMAILGGCAAKGLIAPAQIGAYDPVEAARKNCEQKGFTVFDSPQEAYRSANMVLLAVKPQMIGDLLQSLKQTAKESKPLVITIAAGISTDYIKSYLGSDTPVIRVMPNTPLLIGQGASALCHTPEVTAEQFSRVRALFDALGVTACIEESQMNAIISVNGSVPAYVYYFLRALMQAAEKEGIDPEVAKLLLCHTFIGSANMVLQSEDDIDELIRKVCSPGGTTLAALAEFDRNGISAAIQAGCDACRNRAEELGK